MFNSIWVMISADSANLVSLRRVILASRSALITARSHLFFFFLQFPNFSQKVGGYPDHRKFPLFLNLKAQGEHLGGQVQLVGGETVHQGLAGHSVV